MAYIHGTNDSVRYHFYTAQLAWQFAKEMASYGRTIVDFGKDESRSINKYYVDIA